MTIQKLELDNFSGTDTKNQQFCGSRKPRFETLNHLSTALSSRRPKEGAERPPATAPGENWRDPLGESFAEAEPRGNSAGTQESLEFPAIYGMIFPFKDPCMDDFPII